MSSVKGLSNYNVEEGSLTGIHTSTFQLPMSSILLVKTVVNLLTPDGSGGNRNY